MTQPTGTAKRRTLRAPVGEGHGCPVSQFVRIDELDVLYVHPEGEGHGCPVSQFVRIDELDVLYVHPEGEGHGCPESKVPFECETESADRLGIVLEKDKGLHDDELEEGPFLVPMLHLPLAWTDQPA